MPFAKRGGYLARAVRPGNFSAVTGACQMFRRDVFEQVGDYNEELAVGFNDADFCLRVCVSSRGFEQKEHRKLSSRSIGSAHA
ncbi:hypothetical protein ABG972_09430, partial [Collinsella aerofaciens]|uniref:glycosyltransferase family 2 protein n=1 Tax=Collinsella aerofaciens TaxID=74426 RepID=UPI00325BA7DD